MGRSAQTIRGDHVLTETDITNRWTGATGSEFPIIIGPAQLLGNAVARSTQTFDSFHHDRKSSNAGHTTFATPEFSAGAVRDPYLRRRHGTGRAGSYRSHHRAIAEWVYGMVL